MDKKIDLHNDVWRHSFTKRNISLSGIPIALELIRDMHNCWQSESLGISVLDHGIMVWDWFLSIMLYYSHVRLPKNFLESIESVDILYTSVHCFSDVKKYCIYHDCGKPYCETVDEEGKRHFPGHADMSCMTYRSVFPKESPLVSELIRLDMVMHTEGAEKIEEMGIDQQTMNTLLLVGFAELNANATLFGGYESTSFKIKFKKLTRRFNRFYKPLSS